MKLHAAKPLWTRAFFILGLVLFGAPATVFGQCTNVSFGSITNLAAGDGPSFVAVADFNGDGIPDFAVADLFGNSVTILLSDGSGGFTSSTVPVGGGSYGVAAADFNGDGKPDLVVANGSDSTVTILLGDGRGGFASSTVPVGGGPIAFAVGDFNGDGNLDIAVANFNDFTVTILLGDGKGNFCPSAASPIPAGYFPRSLAAADFNGDGNLDLAVANAYSDTVTILLGDGKGGFIPASGSPITVGSGSSAVVTGDFNDDGIPDLAVANPYSDSVTILLGDGHGGFKQSAGSPFAAGSGPSSLAIGDFNGDGRIDLATANEVDGTVTILLGDGKGGFTQSPGPPIIIGNSIDCIVAGDFKRDPRRDFRRDFKCDCRRDSRRDLAVGNLYGNTLTILLNTCPGDQAPPPCNAPPQITAIAQQGNDILITWTATANKTNVVQVTNGRPGGCPMNSFTDLSPLIIPSGCGLTCTNYLDIGGATNCPARYYRVRQVQ